MTKCHIEVRVCSVVTIKFLLRYLCIVKRRAVINSLLSDVGVADLPLPSRSECLKNVRKHFQHGEDSPDDGTGCGYEAVTTETKQSQ